NVMGDWWFRAWDRVLAFKDLVGLSASPSDQPCDGWQRRLASDEACRSKDPSPTAAKRTPCQANTLAGYTTLLYITAMLETDQ
ncbi:hypothetical protein, partial [Bradyrhizobium sp. sGM-13]|uniref:hypothetical protein n=1 Tax=Bradyrhizobium sp. sGM-13 TaxID=2831781 RepID=UPI001BCBB3D1